MNSTIDAVLRSWPAEPFLATTLLLSALIYARGWRRLNRRDPQRWHSGRLAAYLGGLLAVYLALASPVETFAALLLSAHMVQHLLLMMVAPPLIWLGWPLVPMLRGLPEPVRTYWVAPALRSRMVRTFFGTLAHPLVAWPVYVATNWLWHTPGAYEAALANRDWHALEHLCFTLAGLLFWFPVVRPFPFRPRWSEWLLVPYLLLGDVQNTVLAAWLTLSSTVIYPHYANMPRIAGTSAVADQSLAGALMWVPGSIAFLVPLFFIGVRMLYGSGRKLSRDCGTKLRLTDATADRFDLLRVPVIGRLLGWRPTRRAIQVTLLVLAAAMVLDGLTGTQIGAMNLAGVLPWIHWRGFVVLTLLVAGNFFCYACPFTLPRAIGRRWLPAGRNWPRALQNKWLAVGLLVLFLWSYEAFSLWDSPWLTAWIVLAYFAAALALDGFFRAGSFCKYVCPIGQFNFVGSLVSPLEVAARDPHVCSTCRTHECLNGSATIPGCELQLLQPKKVGNLDCTFCLDCVHSCPYDNVGVLAVIPTHSLWTDRLRAGMGRLSGRTDLAALVVLLTFGALANAAGMTSPILHLQDQLQASANSLPRWLCVGGYYLFTLLAAPVALIAIAAMFSHRWSGAGGDSWPVALRYCFALAPVGFAMWVAHYSFHLVTSYASIVPTSQQFAARFGFASVGQPAWQCACCQPVGEWLLSAEILVLEVGLLLSLYAAFRIAEGTTATVRRAIGSLLPWAALIAILFASSVWILLQPMEMRGMLDGAGPEVSNVVRNE
jgi:cytochrome c oxidase assembly factor CtaG/polyferredoxin